MKSETKVDSKKLMREILGEIVESVLNHEMSEKYIDIKEAWEESFIHPMMSKLGILHNFEIPEKSFYQIKMHQQFIFNLCGYHVLFSFLNLVNFLSSGFEGYLNNIINSKQFWLFHNRTRRFIYEYSVKNKLNHAKGLWSKEWCFYGDMERSHLKAIMNENHEFVSSFKRNRAIEVYHCVLEYQFGRFVTELGKLAEIQQQIDKFRRDNTSKNGRAICIFIGACNHWVGFLAHKKMHKTEYIFLDSRNKDYLFWTAEDIFVEIEKINLQKIKDKLEPWDDFRKMTAAQCVADIQSVVSLLLDVFEYDNKLGDHFYLQNFRQSYDRFYYNCLNELKLSLINKSFIKKNLFHSKSTANYRHLEQTLFQFKNFMVMRNSMSLFYRLQISEIFIKFAEVFDSMREILKNEPWAYAFNDNATYCINNHTKLLLI